MGKSEVWHMKANAHSGTARIHLEMQGDAGEMQGRCMGDAGEMQWRCSGDAGEMQGRYSGDAGEIQGHRPDPPG